ncbi:MAG: site-specific integrase [Bacteriovoracaceae bacterium]|jgi:site-specific recombinase XerD|nr:site-specific integrase [Bacteriovoracaceae bacterium]
MTPLAPLISSFFRSYLPKDRGFSENTCDTYAHAFKLFLSFAAEKLKTKPSTLSVEQLNAEMVISFLTSLEESRSNSSSTRNSRLAAIKSFMRYIELKVPSCMEQVCQIRAIPSKRHETPLIKHLNSEEVQAILNMPDLNTKLGVRDRAMLHLCYSAGLRVSELTNLLKTNIDLGKSPSVNIIGKGRRERCLPLWKNTANDLKSWLKVRGKSNHEELFLNSKGEPISRAGFEYLLNKYVKKASKKAPTLLDRKVSPHQLRHSCALLILQATKDIRKVSLWLGHSDIKTTEIYLRIDPSEKLEAMESVVPLRLRKGKFKAPDSLIASLIG